MTEIKNELSKATDYLVENGAVILGELIGGALGGIGIPIVSNSIMIYRQKRLERNIKLFIEELLKRQQEIEIRLSTIDESKMDFIKNSLLPVTLDYILNEKQRDKIKFYVNGFKNLIMNDVVFADITDKIDSESLIILYYDILKEMTVLDILMFKEIVLNLNQNNSKKKEMVKLNGSDLVEITRKFSSDKLRDLRLILKPIALGELSAEEEYSFDMSQIKLTAVGEKFYHFITD